MEGPYYDESDTSNTNPVYRMWIYAWKGNTLAWQDNGEFTSINAGVVQERGNSTTEVMSQDAITKELTKLESLGQQVIYDVTINNASAKFSSLSALLSSENLSTLIPVAVRCGGMSIRFVLTSDNKYVQYNLLADSFTTDTTQWAIYDTGVYVESVEFAYIKTDALGRIIIAVKKDGSIFFGNGVPPKIVNYIQQKIEELSLDEYADIVTFLGSLIENDKTLQQLLYEKVDKEEGKSLIDSNVANSESSIISPEFFELKTDSENKIIEGFEKDGTKHVYVDEKIEGSVSVGGKLSINGYIVAHENTDGIETQEDADGRILGNTKQNGTKIHYTHNEFKQDVSFNGKVEVCNKYSERICRIENIVNQCS